MRKVIVIYDDSRKTNPLIKSITGKKGFGDTIYKRVTQRNRMREFFRSLPEVSFFADRKEIADRIPAENLNDAVILLYSNYVLADPDAMKLLVEKAVYAHENYNVIKNDKIACVIFNGADSYLSSKEENYNSYPSIETECFADISDVSVFRQFITGGFEARFFNSLEGDDVTVTKSSGNKEKIKAEYNFYGLLPDSMKQWFVRPFDYKEEDDKASYTMQRYHMTDLAIRYIHGAIGTGEFEDILNNVFTFIKMRTKKEITPAEYESTAQSLYIDKVVKRMEMLKQHPDYGKIEALFKSSTGYNDIDEISGRYKRIYHKIRDERKFISLKVVGHGDLCFSNMLYSHEADLLMLIDPKGANSEDELYMDPYYDIAKLSHSICGHYDFFNSDLYEITLDENLKAHVKVDADNREYVKLFKKKLNENGIDFKLIRLYETSLFLSMLPLHMDRPKKVFAFLLNAIAIMDSLEENENVQ